MVEKYYNENDELGVLYSPGLVQAGLPGIMRNSHMIKGLLNIG